MLAAIASVTILIQPLIIDLMVWGVLRMLMGVCFSGPAIVVESWLNDKTNNDTRGQVLSVYIVIDLTIVTLAN